MANKTIDELTAGTNLDGTELFHAIQGGNSRKFSGLDLLTPALGAADQALVRAASSAALRGHIYDLTFSNNATDTNNDIDTEAGEAASEEANPVLMVLASAITKQLDAGWVVGTGQGGLDTGSKANSTWYYRWLIQRSDTGVVDVLLSASATSPTMPPSYDRKRRLPGAFRTDSSGNIEGLTQAGKRFYWKAIRGLDFSGAASVGASTNHTISVPPGYRVTADVNAQIGSSAGGYGFRLHCPDIATGISAGGSAPLASLTAEDGAGSYTGGQVLVLTNTAAQISSTANGAESLRIYTNGWIED